MGLLVSLDHQRIKFHLMAVEQELRNSKIKLSPKLKKERQRNITFLHKYWKRGKFPINTDYPGKVEPHIRDKFGTACAMGYIIEESGNKQLVDDLEESNNLVRVEDVHEGPLIDWLNASGLTKEEAAKIQPTYGGFYEHSPPYLAPEPSHGLVWAIFWVAFIVLLIGIEYINYGIVRNLHISKPKIKYLKHFVYAASAVAISATLAFVLMIGAYTFGWS